MTQSKHTSRTSCLQNWNLHSVEGHDKQNQTQIKKSKRLLKFKKKKKGFVCHGGRDVRLTFEKEFWKITVGEKKLKEWEQGRTKLIFFISQIVIMEWHNELEREKKI